MTKARIYVCHTFYHVYVACLKEFSLGRQNPAAKGQATLVLSKMSTSFGTLYERAKASKIFEEVVWFDEKDYTFFPELVELKKDRGNIVSNMWQRIRFCQKTGELLEPFVPVDFREYKDIYVFCDSDPIGYYLAYKKIAYHAVEDGLNCLRYRDTAREDNRGHFSFKAKMAAWGLIFIQNGYSKYCIDMEVNDLSALDHPTDKMIEVPREKLVEALTKEEQVLLTNLFIRDAASLRGALQSAKDKKRPIVLILTEPLCSDLETREKLFRDMIDKYGVVNGQNAVVVMKPHPRDLLDYRTIFREHIVLDADFPMEILNFTDAVFDRVVTVYTVPSSIHCAREKIYLGNEWMDRYEDASFHASVKNATGQIT